MKKYISTILFIVCVISLLVCNKFGDDNKSEIDYPWEIGEKSNLKFYDGNINLSIDESRLTIDEVEPYLKNMSSTDGNTTAYRKLLCAYDLVKYSDENII